MRGKNLFNNLFGDVEQQEPVADGEPERGRSAELIRLRNEHLLTRYVYWGMDARNRYEWVVKRLSEEFYLSESTVTQIIQANSALLKRLKKNEFNIGSCKKKYWWMVW